MSVGESNTTIAIIGGGVSGALAAFHLARQHTAARVVVFDPRPELGLGLAYSTPSLRHLLNVPAGKISALPEEPDHFLTWLREHHDPEATPGTFAPRAVFGRYIQWLLAQACGVEHDSHAVVDLRAIELGAVLTLNDGCQFRADYVVMATGNFDPAALPGISQAAQDSGAYCHNAWTAETYDALPQDAPVALIGTGLTGIDVVLRLRELGHRGIITAVSRHGILPNRHAGYVPLTQSAIPSGTEPTCLAYVRVLHAVLRHGVSWPAAIDSLRATTNDLWLALPLREQERFRRHLQRRWDVVRHRMAPTIADRIEAELRAGTLVIRKGHLARVEALAQGAAVALRTRVGVETFTTTRVINCTGPGMNYRRVNSPLLDSLFAQGLIVPGPLGGGFYCDSEGAMIDAAGNASEVLFNLGPGRLGTLLESIAVPEIRMQAVDLAETLRKYLEQRKSAEAVGGRDEAKLMEAVAS